MKTDTNWIEKIGAPSFAAIAEMVAALECDYDRLGELREERADWVDNDGGDDDEQTRTAADWSKEFPTESAELAALETAAGTCDDRDDAAQRIAEDPLSIRIFGEKIHGVWEIDRLEFLLTTGGPAVRIMVEVDEHGMPNRAWMEVQDWGTPWEHYHAAEADTLLAYCLEFGEFSAD